jgi:hypothetical protein
MTDFPTFRLVSPNMRSGRIASFQRLLNHRFQQWEVDRRVTVDGEYGPHTREAVREVIFGLGIAQAELEHGVTPALRLKIRNPQRRSRTELKRAAGRADWRRRLRRLHEGHGPAAAIAYARKHAGMTESPPGSNRGPAIDQWNRLCGVPPGPAAYWCGTACNAFLMAAGFPAQPWLKYCPDIESKAKKGFGGWSWHSEPRPGDLVLYGTGNAEHVGLVEGMSGGMLVTYEGNTSSGTSGSQSNGGGCFLRRRDPHAPGFPARGYARPPYDRARTTP